MKKLLQVNISPPIRAYTHHAYRLSIMSVTDHYLPWFYSNYIQLCCQDLSQFADRSYEIYRAYISLPFGYNIYVPEKYYRPCGLVTHTLDRRILSGLCRKITSFIIECIDQGYFFWSHVDFEILSENNISSRNPFNHGVLVCGYDTEKQLLDILWYDKTGKYSIQTVSFVQFENAYERTHLESLGPKHQDIYLFRYEPTSYQFDPQWVAEQLYDYLNSLNTAARFRMFSNPSGHLYYGMKTYEFGLKRHLSIAEKKPSFFKFHLIHILWEHKKCMFQRIKYLEEHGYLDPSVRLSDDYIAIEEKVYKLRMAMLKFELREDPGIAKRVSKAIGEVSDREYDILSRVLHGLTIYGCTTQLEADQSVQQDLGPLRSVSLYDQTASSTLPW